MATLRLLAACFALYYPLHWLANTLPEVLGGLVRTALGGELQRWYVSQWGATLRVDGGPPQFWFDLVIGGAFVWIARSTGWIGSTALAVLALTLGRKWGLMLMRQGWPPAWMPVAGEILAIFLAVLAVWWMRVGIWRPAAALCVPAAVMPMVLFSRSSPFQFLFIEWLPVLAATTVTALAHRPIELPRVRWLTAVVGLTVAAGLALGTREVEKVVEERDRAQTAAVLSGLRKPSPDLPYEKQFFQRGVCFTAEAGVGYHSQQARNMLAKLPAYGVNAIALVPYGFSRSSPITIRPAGRGSWESDEGVEILAALAHSQELKVLLKPHVWRVTEDRLQTAEARAQWFRQYASFIEHYARLASRTHADLFAVGTEFGWLAQYEKEWRDIIARVRALYKGPMTYCATQGPEFETIQFWDALDYIGLDNYYPLPDDYSAADVVRKVEQVHKKYGKPVVFTEAGFSAVINAHRAPWEDETSKPLSLETQVRAYEALLHAFYDKPWFHGVYWWKVGTNGYGGPENNSMTPWRKPAMEVVKRYYTSGRR